MKYQICAFYKFINLGNYQTLQSRILSLMQLYQIRGTFLLSREGVNACIAGHKQDVSLLMTETKRTMGIDSLDVKYSYADKMPFRKAKVKLKKEIVTMGLEGIDPITMAGTYVDAHEWNSLIADSEVLVLDSRNDYEVKIGTFVRAVNPRINNFRDFPRYAEQNLDPKKHKKVAMFCTGGIRCEKSTSLLKSMGFEEIYHLKGGILKYLEEVSVNQSLWEGECFVFDDRIAVDHHLRQGSYEMCFGCRAPVSREDKKDPNYEKGVSCPTCYHKSSNEDKERFRDRQKQKIHDQDLTHQ